MPTTAAAAAGLLLLLLAARARAVLPLPEYVRPCSLTASDRKLSACATEHARLVMPRVMKGDPKYNIPVLDPLHLERMEVINGKGPLGLQLTATDVDIFGLPAMIINNVTHLSKPLVITYVSTLPEVTVRAKYSISGRILLLPIVGDGRVVMTLKNLRLLYQYSAELQRRRDGEVYLVPQPGARLDADADGLTVHLDNLFNGDKTLVESTNKFLNEEWREVFESMKPSFNKELSDLINSILTGIFSQVPMRIGFLDFEEFTKDKEKFKVVDKSNEP